ncbi:flagellar basal-body MS-ring/collar protein FliF [Thiocystis violascens]|uniref:Flagellar M-ring protein n=1 Tax=Thiocystis violascens (strain ATCC 17096 / DSM 198 / 6111) TaxID=765911 RepID=I3Y609_THIV6|nr:flagellar basal-body MS-ring/collar protein FliF [Thiocystis violascens]AFL72427.1 flagellar basal-body M-ring protein/flagellar hook-basal body protein FliF [Thiocystis violascens DSM 198]
MASSLTAALSTSLQSFNEMPAGRQIALIGMIAGGLVAVVAILYWALRPTYAPLFAQVDGAEAAEMMQALTSMGVPYKVDSASGRIEIPQQRIAETRLLLAGQGFPKESDIGFELLQDNAGFGSSRLIEGARFQRALEGELGRSVAALEPVERARVHIAQAERSVFVRERTPPSASVVVHLRGNRSLTEAQVGAIVHLVSASVPELLPERVTVVDQTGRLLTVDDDKKSANLSLDHLDYTNRVETGFVERVQSLLIPIVGRDRVRVQVAADLDFSRVERTEEAFDPDRTAVRSEQSNEEEKIGVDPVIGGIPGALTNQPPAGGAVGGPAAGAAANPQLPSSRSQQTTRNYEVDRTISHIQETPGGIRRLSAAVVVDYRDETNDAGEVVRVPRSDAELESIRALVRGAVGFDEKRGDSINVSSVSFVPDTAEEDAIPFWSETWFLELVKVVGGLILALLVLLTVVKPGLQQLMPKPPEPEPEPESLALGADGEELPALTDESQSDDELVALSHQGSAHPSLTGPKGTTQQQLDLEAIREMVREDPKRVVQVMKLWLVEDGS